MPFRELSCKRPCEATGILWNVLLMSTLWEALSSPPPDCTWLHHRFSFLSHAVSSFFHLQWNLNSPTAPVVLRCVQDVVVYYNRLPFMPLFHYRYGSRTLVSSRVSVQVDPLLTDKSRWTCKGRTDGTKWHNNQLLHAALMNWLRRC